MPKSTVTKATKIVSVCSESRTCPWMAVLAMTT
jgi:hypothetical protein